MVCVPARFKANIGVPSGFFGGAWHCIALMAVESTLMPYACTVSRPDALMPTGSWGGEWINKCRR
jgi:hypothetical protein